jgi:hypothetical protein
MWRGMNKISVVFSEVEHTFSEIPLNKVFCRYNIYEGEKKMIVDITTICIPG